MSMKMRGPTAPMTEQQQASAEVPENPPVMVTVECVFELLQDALNKAVEAHGNKAKAFAWDVKGHFISEVGHYRARGVTLAPPCA